MTTEIKIFAVVGSLTLLILVGGAFFLTKENKSVPENEIVTRNGLHWHPKLSIYIKGQKQQLEEGIGLGAVEMSIHTHKEDYKDGVIHMEIPGVVKKSDTRLGRFFQIWGREFPSKGNVKMLVNGKENGDFENYLMKDKDNIEIRSD